MQSYRVHLYDSISGDWSDLLDDDRELYLISASDSGLDILKAMDDYFRARGIVTDPDDVLVLHESMRTANGGWFITATYGRNGVLIIVAQPE